MYGRVVFVLCQPAVTALHTAGWNSPIVEAKKKERKTYCSDWPALLTGRSTTPTNTLSIHGR